MWRLRRKTERGWYDGFHIHTGEEAKGLCEILNNLERERDEARIELEKYTTDSEDDALYNVRRLRKELTAVTAQRDGIDSMYYKIIKEVLECDPIPACKREDDHLEPPWEVIARIREQRDRLAEALQDLIESCNCIDSVDFMPVSMPEAFEKAQQALQSLTNPNVQGHVRREELQPDQTASSASHVPPCSGSSSFNQ
jgi:hypothetical protein